ncbi:hypothetical protein [Citrobacter freundii]|nr:hypothetical protein [Citrobacter freundii]
MVAGRRGGDWRRHESDSPYYLSLIGGAVWAGAKKYDYKQNAESF